MNAEPAHSYRLKIEFAQSSDPGRDPNKQVNEDSCGYAETRFGHLMVLCDGMGGHYGGQEASRTAITTIFEVFEQNQALMSPVVALKAAIEEAGRRVYLLGGPPENRTRPGSTVVAMLLHDRGVDVAHVGDSRAYVIRSGQIYPLTRDHSMVQGMIDAGMLTEEQAIGHPDANKITRALGMKPEVEVELRPEPMELWSGDILLQSSDGLTDLALGSDILNITLKALAAGPVAHACNVLVQTANERGGHDNITVQMARVIEVGPKPMTIPGGPSRAVAAEPLAPTAPPLPETVHMTKPDSPTPIGGYSLANARAAAAAAAGNHAPAGSPVLPTANELTPPLGGVGLHGTFVMSPGQQPGLQAQLGSMNSPQQPALQAQLGSMNSPQQPALQAQLNSTTPGGLGPPAALAPTAPPLTPTAPPASVVPVAPPMAPPVSAPAPGPTMTEGGAPSHQPWSSANYEGPPVAPPMGPPPGTTGPLPAVPPGALQSYKEGGVGALPLPPPAPVLRPGFGPPAPTQVTRSPSYPGGGPVPFTPAPVSTTMRGAQPAQGGIVFVIIGMSAVIAVLILVVIWALWLR